VLASAQYLKRGLEHRQRLAATDDGGSWTYEQLAQGTESVAAGLLSRADWTPGNRVGLFLPRRKESVALLLGTFDAGGIAVPLSLRGTPREILHGLTDASISHLVLQAEQRLLLTHDAVAMGSEIKVPALLDPSSLIYGSSRTQRPDVDVEDPALILYTSGTTSLPKGAVHTHSSLMAQVDVLHQAWGWHADDRLLHVLPLHHIHGLVNGLLGALWAGAELRFMDSFSPAAVWGEFAARGCTVFYGVPTIYHQLADAWRQQDAHTRRQWSEGGNALRLAVSGSAALPVRLWNQWQEITGQALLERYGMTEIGMAISNPLHGDRRAGTVGQPLPGVEVRIVPDDGRDAPEGEPGEIWVRGRTLFREYWNQPAATQAVFRDEQFFATGDVAMWEQGYIRICGRASVDILKSAGYKLSALEIEEVLREHPLVSEVAVVGVPDPEWGEVVTACVVPRPGPPLDVESMRVWCRDRLAPYKTPRRWHVMAQLPRNAMGKVTKPELVRQLIGRDE
jgi:malonyl-CoA/methylmalonyl-CoA synthetase